MEKQNITYEIFLNNETSLLSLCVILKLNNVDM